MSEPEDFLARWSRRKREAAETPQPAAPDEAPATEPQAEAPAAAPSVDLAALPPIDAITATTDIRGYLAPGVPAELTRAALRRAWVADPAIRDFVGIAENQWDFNDPHGVPGFGPLAEDTARLMARMLEESASAEPAPPAPAAPSGADAGATAGETVRPVVDQPVPGEQPEPSIEPDMLPTQEAAVAPQQDDPQSSLPRVSGRGHGGALPK